MIWEFLLFVLVGFGAQLVDGALGMAYGVISTSVLLSTGVSPAAASAAVHTAEVFTTGVSGLSHAYFRNVDWPLFRRLAIAGVGGGVAGAVLVSHLPGDGVRPFVAAYLMLMGAIILYKAWHGRPAAAGGGVGVVPLGLGGGFLDAIGGGGWGPIVVSTLLGRGNLPRYAVGTVNTAEFFVTLAISATFISAIGLAHWQIVAGLLAGGVIAAPLAGFVGQRIPHRPFMVAVGLLVIAISVRTLWLTL
jgi:uncharacterized membrane protein YfcA